MKFLSQINVNTEYTLPIVDGVNGQVLTTDGNGAVYWGSISAGVTNLDGLTDVILTSPSSGQLLRYGIPPGSGETQPVWYNFTPNYLTPSSSIDNLSDVTITTATAGQILQWNGSAWVNATLSTVEYVSKVQHLVKCGVAVTKGQAVYVTTSDGTNMIVGLASNASEPTSSKVIGLAASTGAINDQIFVVTEGLIAGLNTSTATAGDPVWLGTGGNLIFGLVNKPVAPAHLVYLGVVTRVQANNGEIFVNVQNGFELNELHDVLISSPSAGQLIRRDSDGLWKNWTPNYLTSLPVHNHDDRYYTENEIAAFFGGETPIAGYNHTNWDTAYSWGNHALAGYLTSFTETDPTVPAHVKTITTTEKSNWNTAYGWGNHALAGYATQTWVGLNYYNEGEIDDFFSGAEPISGYNKSNWDTAYGWGNHALAGYQPAATAITTSNISSQDVRSSRYLTNYSLNTSDAFQAWNLYETGTADLNPTADNWWYGMRVSHGDAVAYYSYTLATNFFSDDIRFRRVQGGVKQAWRTIFHTGNFTDNSANWNTAYNDRITAAAVTGTSTKTLTLTQGDGGTVTATWTDYDTDNDAQVLTWTAPSKELAISNGNSITLDGLATEDYVLSQGFTTFQPWNAGTGSINYTAGKVGIGTASPSSVVHIEGTTTGTGAGPDAILYVKQNGGWSANEPWALYVEGYSYLNGFRINAADGVRALYKTTPGGQLGFAVSDNAPITFAQNNETYRLYIAPDGNVGIGTTSPTGKLSVVGDGTEYSNIVLRNGSNQEHLIYASTNIQYNLIGSGAPTWIWGQQGGAERMRLNNTGLGIGTNSPGEKLTIIGDNAVFAAKSQTADASLPTKRIAEFAGIYNSGSNGHQMFISSTAELGPWEFNLTKTWGGILTLGVSTNGTERTRGITINSSGNVGIGTTNPIYKLQVAGSAYVNGGTLYIDSDQYIRWGNSNQGIVGSNDSHIAIVSGGSTRQTIYADGRTYFPGLDLAISNTNSDHGASTYFRGDTGHFVFGVKNGNTLYFNYGNGGGTIQSYGTLNHSGNLNVVGGGNIRVGQSGSHNNLNFVRSDSAGVGAVGWKDNGFFYIGGHPDYGPNAGNDVRVYGFGASLYFGNNTAGDVARISNTGVFSYGGSEVATRAWVQAQGYITGYTETDTLASVTGRGASTSTKITANGGIYSPKIGIASSNLDDVTNGAPWYGIGQSTSTGWYGNQQTVQLAGYFGVVIKTANTQVDFDMTGYGGSVNVSQGTLRVGGNVVWHAGNDGSGSGLDADLLDGYNHSNFIGLNGNSYFQLTTWLQSTGTHGFYSPSSGAGTHFYPAVTSYGSFRIEGGANIFLGIELFTLTRKPTWMWDNNGGGMYSQSDSVWYYYYSHSSGRLHIGASSGNAVWHSGDFTSTNISNWNAAYNDRITAVAVSGTGTKTLTLTQQDGGTLTATWTDYDTDNDAQTLSWDQGQTLLSISGGNDITLTGLATEDYVNSQGFVTSSGTVAGVVRTVTGTNSAELVRGNMGDNDQARILVGATSSNAGYLEIATADDGTEPIYVRQYTGVFSSLTRTATLLDGSGNTTFPGNLTIGGTFTENSSIRFKENIQPLEPALAKVEQLNPVTYTKITSQEEEVGLIAEEVAELFPEVVTYNENGQPQGIQYQRLSVILLKAVQELTERVNKLENK